jgi:acetylornithine/succinyldiaminopimelate/putrescine aminotransferase
LLQSIGLDAIYERAEGDYLWQRRDERLVPVLDLVGGYGANLFGHHHPELVAVAHRHFEEKRPFHAQAACRPGAARLAESLCRRLGDYVVTFTNSGAETIEAALKHALLERPRPMFWAVQRAFHGKTLGAIQFNWSYRAPYEGHGPRVRFLDPSDPAGYQAVESEIESVSAVFLEPIAGEGGIRRLPDEFVQWISPLCHRAGVPIVVDEIQSGMGRTGTFLACQQMGLEPDYLCLSKSLGGGLAKIGALLVKRQRFVEEFSIKHTSTFAEDDFSCDIAYKALELLERDRLPKRCAALGRFLADQLEELRSIYPDKIREVRSHGLMIGFELQDHSDSYTLGALSQQGYLGYFAAAFLLNEHDIRVVPTLSDPCTLRIEPSAYITEHDLTRFVRAAEDLCESLRAFS